MVGNVLNYTIRANSAKLPPPENELGSSGMVRKYIEIITNYV
jgi:hypothetical protein